MSDSEEKFEIKDEYLPPQGESRRQMKKLLSWTVSEATDAQRKWHEEENAEGMRGPIFLWVAAHELVELAERYTVTKDKKILLLAIQICAMNSFAIPKWCAVPYVQIFRGLNHYKIES